MPMPAMLMDFVSIMEGIATIEDLYAALAAITIELGFQHFALTHHRFRPDPGPPAIRLHNYPEAWAEHYDRNGLGAIDPVHRASQLVCAGFTWKSIVQFMSLSKSDYQIFALGRDHGISDGFTIPANVPGEFSGSVTFACSDGLFVPRAVVPAAQVAGSFAFEAVRRLQSSRGTVNTRHHPALTDRQRDCVKWVALGKSDWEIGCILGISKPTVTLHLKNACERYNVSKRTLLVTRTLFDGTLTFNDLSRP